MSDLNTVIKSNTKVLFIKVAPSGKSELARAGTCATERSQNRTTRAYNPNWEVVPVGSSGSQEQEAAPQGAAKTGKNDENRNRADLRSCELRPLGGHVWRLRNKASRLAKL